MPMAPTVGASQPPPSPAAGTDPNVLVSGAASQQGPSVSERQQFFMRQIQDLYSRLGDLARQYPAFADAAQAAQKIITEQGMVAVVSDMNGGTEVAAPTL